VMQGHMPTEGLIGRLCSSKHKLAPGNSEHAEVDLLDPVHRAEAADMSEHGQVRHALAEVLH